jgi:hypothetical protein
MQRSSEMRVTIYQTTRPDISEESQLLLRNVYRTNTEVLGGNRTVHVYIMQLSCQFPVSFPWT